MKIYNDSATNLPASVRPKPQMPDPLRRAVERQLSQNWDAFTEGDPATFEIMRAINLTRVLRGDQSGH
jgi:hypothetical protein